MQFDGPVLELHDRVAPRFDQRLAALGPDVVAAAPFDERRYLRRLREDDPTRAIGDALLDQRTVAGHREHLADRGVLARAASIRTGAPRAVSDEEALAIVDAVRPLMQRSARDGDRTRRAARATTGRAGPARAAATPIRARGRWATTTARSTGAPAARREHTAGRLKWSHG